MLHITVFTPGGVVLWDSDSSSSSERSGARIPESVLNSFIADVYLDGKITGSSQIPWKKHGYTVRHSTLNELGQLRIAVAHESIVYIEYADTLLSDCRRILKSLAGGGPDYDLADVDFDKFGRLVLARLKELQVAQQSKQQHQQSLDDNKNQNESVSMQAEADEEQQTEQQQDDTTRKPKPRRRKGKKPEVEATSTSTAAKSKKKMRRWDDDGSEYDSNGPLDFSSETQSESRAHVTEREDDMDTAQWTQTKQGEVVPGFLENELREILDENENDDAPESNSAGFFGQLLGGKSKSALTPQDLAKTHEKMVAHLLKKNVAREAAEHLWQGVEASLVGTKSGSGGFRSLWNSGVDDTARESMKDALCRILTPSTSVDLLHEIKRKRDKPYVISVVGVNGVGKSTNLAKIAFWLIQNNYRVLVAACDTFRSGAVEQLRVHVTRLKALSERLGRSSSDVEIFDQGYGKDAAVIAQKAVEHGKRNKFDIVLIDTAGRRHNDDRLMSSLEKFGNLANPDKIIMVAEALVGTDSVMQARHFNSAFGPNRHLDFFLVSKCDTVGDMVGTLVNMTYSTGVPVLFVGVGQNFTDLRALSVDWAVDLLLK